MSSDEKMTVADLMEALKKFPPNALVTINIKQFNKVYGVFQAGISKRKVSECEYSEIRNGYGGCMIEICLPEGAYLAHYRKDTKKIV